MGASQQVSASLAAAPVGPGLVQQAVGTNAVSDSVPATFGSVVGAGHSVIACVSVLSTDAVADVRTGESDTGLTRACTSTVAGVTTEIWYLHDVDPTNQSVVLFGTSSTRGSIAISEWTTLTNAAPGATNTNAQIAATAVVTNSVTPATTRNLVIAVGGWTADQYASGPINSFTRLTPTGGGAAFQEEAYISQSAATAKSTGWTLSLGINSASCIATFSAT